MPIHFQKKVIVTVIEIARKIPKEFNHMSLILSSFLGAKNIPCKTF